MIPFDLYHWCPPLMIKTAKTTFTRGLIKTIGSELEKHYKTLTLIRWWHEVPGFDFKDQTCSLQDSCATEESWVAKKKFSWCHLVHNPVQTANFIHQQLSGLSDIWCTLEKYNLRNKSITWWWSMWFKCLRKVSDWEREDRCITLKYALPVVISPFKLRCTALHLLCTFAAIQINLN